MNDLFAADAKLPRLRISTTTRWHRSIPSLTFSDRYPSSTTTDFSTGRIYGTPPVLGSGFTRIVDGEITSPAPATLEILCRHQVPYSASPADMELSTPTGIAIFANLAQKIVDAYPPMIPLEDRLRDRYPGAYRAVPLSSGVVEGTNFDVIQDRIVMLETNLDDAPGETVGYVVEKLREAGAVDVYVTTASGKKNRPVQILHIITNQLDVPGPCGYSHGGDRDARCEDPRYSPVGGEPIPGNR